MRDPSAALALPALSCSRALKEQGRNRFPSFTSGCDLCRDKKKGHLNSNSFFVSQGKQTIQTAKGNRKQKQKQKMGKMGSFFLFLLFVSCARSLFVPRWSSLCSADACFAVMGFAAATMDQSCRCNTELSSWSSQVILQHVAALQFTVAFL